MLKAYQWYQYAGFGSTNNVLDLKNLGWRENIPLRVHANWAQARRPECIIVN